MSEPHVFDTGLDLQAVRTPSTFFMQCSAAFHEKAGDFLSLGQQHHRLRVRRLPAGRYANASSKPESAEAAVTDRAPDSAPCRANGISMMRRALLRSSWEDE